MRTLGLLGGATWYSTTTYYQRINQGVQARLGSFRSAELVLYSIDYGRIRASRRDGDFKRLGAHLARACRGLERAGAEGVLLCSNTLHAFAPRIESQLNIPLLHIADAVAEKAHAQGMQRVGLLGTAFTLTRPFYLERLASHGLDVVLPPAPTVIALDHILLEELARGDRRAASRQQFLDAIEALRLTGVEAVVLGCTEIGMLLNADDVDLPLFDTTLLHAQYAVNWSCGDNA